AGPAAAKSVPDAIGRAPATAGRVVQRTLHDRRDAVSYRFLNEELTQVGRDAFTEAVPVPFPLGRLVVDLVHAGVGDAHDRAVADRSSEAREASRRIPPNALPVRHRRRSQENQESCGEPRSSDVHARTPRLFRGHLSATPGLGPRKRLAPRVHYLASRRGRPQVAHQLVWIGLIRRRCRDHVAADGQRSSEDVLALQKVYPTLYNTR